MQNDIDFDDYSVYEIRCMIVEGKILTEDVVSFYDNDGWDDNYPESEYHD